MNPFLNIILFLVWVFAYLGVVCWLSRYRRTKLRAFGVSLPEEYRADKDMSLWLAVFALASLLSFAVYLAMRVTGQLH